MGDWLSRVGGVLGTVVGITIVAGLIFVQCVYPFLRGNTTSVTLTCSDEEIADFCDDPFTMGGFAAMVCSRDELKVTSNYIDNIVIGGEPGDDIPDTLELIFECGILRAKWEWEEGRDPEEFEDFDDAAANDDAKRFMNVYGLWGIGDVTTAEEARQRLFRE